MERANTYSLEGWSLTADEPTTATRIRFYASLEVGLIAWFATILAVAGSFAIAGLPLDVAALLGALAILTAAMRHPAYRTIQARR